jgi:hypothetical protein
MKSRGILVEPRAEDDFLVVGMRLEHRLQRALGVPQVLHGGLVLRRPLRRVRQSAEQNAQHGVLKEQPLDD